MVVYFGDVAWVVGEVERLECGAGLMPCVDCEGTGTFQGCPSGPEDCVPCKGTGKMFVSV
jgi:hypothetical protein